MGECPNGSNADEWALFLSEHSVEYAAVHIAEAIDDAEFEALERAIDRMGWPEIAAFQEELRHGQSIDEDAGGFFLRSIRRLFDLPQRRDPVVTYQEAARALVAEARKED